MPGESNSIQRNQPIVLSYLFPLLTHTWNNKGIGNSKHIKTSEVKLSECKSPKPIFVFFSEPQKTLYLTSAAERPVLQYNTWVQQPSPCWRTLVNKLCVGKVKDPGYEVEVLTLPSTRTGVIYSLVRKTRILKWFTVKWTAERNALSFELCFWSCKPHCTTCEPKGNKICENPWAAIEAAFLRHISPSNRERVHIYWH